MKREVDLGDHVLQIEATKKDVERPLWEVVDEATRLAIGELKDIARGGGIDTNQSARIEACQAILWFRESLVKEGFR